MAVERRPVEMEIKIKAHEKAPRRPAITASFRRDMCPFMEELKLPRRRSVSLAFAAQ